MTDLSDPTDARSHDSWADVAPDALSTFSRIERCATTSVDASLYAPVRDAIAAILGGPATGAALVPASDDRIPACVVFAEQFVVDVAGITDEQRQAMFAATGADAFTFVQTVFVTDVFMRARIAIARLFVVPFLPVSTDDAVPAAAELWPLLEQFMHEVALLHALDPLTSELVRLRGARVHNCRVCQSRRSVRAIDAAGGDDALEALADEQVSERHQVAVRLADVLVTQPAMLDEALVGEVHRSFTVDEVVEIVLDVVRNSANKIAVAFGADAPVVAEGIEFYDIDATGDVVADVDIDVVRTATVG